MLYQKIFKVNAVMCFATPGETPTIFWVWKGFFLQGENWNPINSRTSNTETQTKCNTEKSGASLKYIPHLHDAASSQHELQWRVTKTLLNACATPMPELSPCKQLSILPWLHSTGAQSYSWQLPDKGGIPWLHILHSTCPGNRKSAPSLCQSPAPCCTNSHY